MTSKEAANAKNKKEKRKELEKAMWGFLTKYDNGETVVLLSYKNKEGQQSYDYFYACRNISPAEMIGLFELQKMNFYMDLQKKEK